MDNERIAKRLVRLAKEVTAGAKIQIEIRFSDLDDAADFVETFDIAKLVVRNGKVAGTVDISDLEKMFKSLTADFGVSVNVDLL